MTQTTQRLRIQNAMVAAAKAGTFYFIQYLPATGAAKDINPATDGIAPVSAFANEATSSFEVDGNYGRGYKLKRSAWNFRLEVNFSREVTAEYFEKSLCEDPITLPRDNDKDLDQAVLLLSRTAASHPVQHMPDGGSRFVFDFAVWLGRI